MNRPFYKIVIFLSFLPLFLFSQTDTLSFKKTERYFRFNYDNDVFTSTDRYYTQGIYMELIIPAVKKSPLSKVLLTLNKNAINYYGIELEQDGFTPSSIRHVGVFVGDRPYTAVFFLAHTLTSINTDKKLRLSTKLDIGILGPNAFGEQEQKGIHKALNNIQPLGWEYQLSQDIVLNYDIQYEKGIIDKKYFELTMLAPARLGTLYDDIGAGALIRIGCKQNYFNHLYLPKDFSTNKNRKIQCYAFAKGTVKAVGYNATLQGGVFDRNNIYSISPENITRIITTGYLGIVLAYKHFSIEYTNAYISPELKNGLFHGWGHCVIEVCF